MVALVSRTGRDMQRYNFHGQRQVVGFVPPLSLSHKHNFMKKWSKNTRFTHTVDFLSQKNEEA